MNIPIMKQSLIATLAWKPVKKKERAHVVAEMSVFCLFLKYVQLQ